MSGEAVVEDAEYAEVCEWAADMRAQWQAVTDLLGCGRLHLADLLNRVPIDPPLAEMKLLCALEALPDARKVDTRRALGELGISLHTRLGELGADRRRLIVERFTTRP